MYAKKFSKASRKKSKVHFSVISGILAGLVIFIIYFTSSSSYFYIKDIQISGLQRLSRQEIIQEVSFSPRTSIFKIDLKGLSRRIQAIPQVRKVKFKRKLPSTLIIEIEERVPYAWVEKEEEFLEVDEEGVVLGKALNLENTIPLVRGGIKGWCLI